MAAGIHFASGARMKWTKPVRWLLVAVLLTGVAAHAQEATLSGPRTSIWVSPLPPLVTLGLSVSSRAVWFGARAGVIFQLGPQQFGLDASFSYSSLPSAYRYHASGGAVSVGPVFRPEHAGLLDGLFLQPKIVVGSYGATAFNPDSGQLMTTPESTSFEAHLGANIGWQEHVGHFYWALSAGVSVGYATGMKGFPVSGIWLWQESAQGRSGLVFGLDLDLLRIGVAF
jgi:hypothetical protein